ncbi:hypothetical protein TEA_005487 [Camellia sinensis var. sinensis]|uniref:Methyltransferase type 11 domain-containing protein n=1 Tax=Camellia sinensis var. sinensis TaxID=542762 RepID=A0A4V3WP59_CAMSN|nr:hypothetical protein TEA_005487 [Camellia sinensis var. sinensis]
MISGSYNCTTSRLPTSPATVGVGPTPPLSQGPPAPSIGLWKKKKMKLSVSRASASTKGAVYTEAEAEEEGKLQLQKGIAEFYDESSGLWENIWGDHMHHGFYDPNAASTTTTDSLLSDHRSAQIRMIEEALRFAGVPDKSNSRKKLTAQGLGDFGRTMFWVSSIRPVIRHVSTGCAAGIFLAKEQMVELLTAMCYENPMKRPKSIVDVGCGVGGSSRYLARKYEAQCQGITLSPVQAQMAEGLAASQGLVNKVCVSFIMLSTFQLVFENEQGKVSFQVADALNQPFPDAQFDLVWSMESGEHMLTKQRFFISHSYSSVTTIDTSNPIRYELARVAAPGGTIIIVTWCHRDLSPSEESLRPDETALLKKICDAYYLPAWCSTSDYVKLLQSLSLEDIKAEDWSEHVAPFWPAVIRSALTWNGFISLLRSGWKTIKGALVMPLMIQGYRKGLIKFAIITCRKLNNYEKIKKDVRQQRGKETNHGCFGYRYSGDSQGRDWSEMLPHFGRLYKVSIDMNGFISIACEVENPMKRPKSIVDVGCGIGGSSRYLARKYEAQCQGITLSPSKPKWLKVSFQVADALNQPFPDAQFDLVWSMESGEHMPDKAKFVNELARVAAPGGTIIIVTWCHRDLSPSEESLRPDETALLKKICDAYYLPAWCSTSDYVKLLQSLSLEDIKAEDWSEHVAPFWPAVIRSALTWNGFISLLRSGWKTIKGALVMPLMIQGYRKGLIKFAIITCRKPE